MRVFLDQSQKENIKFYEHCFRIHPRSISREERLRVRSSGVRNIETVTLPWCGYADDLILFLLSRRELQTATNLLNLIFERYGLTINDSKTETMILNDPEPEYANSIINLRNTPLDNVEKFKYLGAFIQRNQPNTGDMEINFRI